MNNPTLKEIEETQQEMKMRTYRIKYNDFGVCHVISKDISDVAFLFFERFSVGDRNDYIIKSIEVMSETDEPIYPKK